MKTKSKLSFKELLDSTKRVQYVNDELVAPIKPVAPQKIKLFSVRRSVTCQELEEEYDSRGLLPAHPYALVLFSKENRSVMDKKKYIATQWKDEVGFCYLTFVRWGGRRDVRCDRDDGRWSDDWWFAGVRKSSAIEPKPSALESLPLELSDIEIRVKGKVYKLIEKKI